MPNHMRGPYLKDILTWRMMIPINLKSDFHVNVMRIFFYHIDIITSVDGQDYLLCLTITCKHSKFRKILRVQGHSSAPMCSHDTSFCF